MRVSARVDYAVRALVQLAADESRMPVKAEHLARTQEIPPKFLLEILRQLKQKKLLVSRRGPDGGYVLARPADEISIADVIRAVEGPLATVRDVSPADLSYEGPTASLPTVGGAVRGRPPADRVGRRARQPAAGARDRDARARAVRRAAERGREPRPRPRSRRAALTPGAGSAHRQRDAVGCPSHVHRAACLQPELLGG